ncbi:MAG: stage II sporulation protein P [Actinomycetia bacterium]|nr:stage II sporulation protein P [Actinomycetes bacterium]
MRRRRPVLIWLPGRRALGPGRRGAEPPAPGPDPWWRRWLKTRRTPLPAGRDDTLASALLSYGLLTAVALLILTVSAPASRASVPATAPPASTAPGPLTRWLNGLGVSRPSARTWLIEGAPLLAWVRGHVPDPWTVHWRSMAAAALSDVTGTPLLNLDHLLVNAVPVLAQAPVPDAAPPPGPPDQVMPGLPGDHGRVWAVLGSRPVVGIYHTHTREAFGTPTVGGAGPYSTDWANTVVQVGWWLAQDLNQRGLGVVQARVDNMREGVLASYDLSLKTAKAIVRWWPSVRILLDVHRGTAGRSQTVARVHGVDTAKICIVVGTGQLLPNPHWHQNLAFALQLVRTLDHTAPGILRGDGVETVPYRYNQELLPADVQIEIGGPENTLQEEREGAWYLAEALAEVIRSGKVPGMAAGR